MTTLIGNGCLWLVIPIQGLKELYTPLEHALSKDDASLCCWHLAGVLPSVSRESPMFSGGGATMDLFQNYWGEHSSFSAENVSVWDLFPLHKPVLCFQAALRSLEPLIHLLFSSFLSYCWQMKYCTLFSQAICASRPHYSYAHQSGRTGDWLQGEHLTQPSVWRSDIG